MMCLVSRSVRVTGAVLLVLAGGAWTPRPVLSQPVNVRFDRLGIDEGLSQNTVTTVLQDDQGFLWIGTEGGLNRYDGYTFAVYKHDLDDSTSLSSSLIHDLYESGDGVLWVATYGGGLNRFDRAAGTFTRYRHDPGDAGTLSSNQVLVLHPGAQGRIWVGTENGLDRFDPATGRVERILSAPAVATTGEVRDIVDGDGGVLWLAMPGRGLARFDPATGRTTTYRHDPTDPNSLSGDLIYCLERAPDGTLWAGTGDAGLNRFDPATGAVTRYRHRPDDPASLSSDAVYDLHAEPDGTLWVATDGGGLNRMVAGTARFEHLRHDPITPFSPGSDRPRVLYEDRGGLLWAGTWDAGLSKMRRSRFQHFYHQPFDPNSLGANDVTSFAEDADGNLWIGTNGGGLDRYDRRTHRFTHFPYRPDHADGIRQPAIRPVYLDQEGTLWAGSSKGIHRIDPATGAVTFVPFAAGMLTDRVIQIHEDRLGRLWAATFRDGLCRIDRRRPAFDCLKDHLSAGAAFSSLNTYALYEADDGLFWVSVWGQGIDVVDPERGRVAHYEHDPADRHSLSQNNVMTFHRDRKGRLWLGTYGGGLNRFDAESGHFLHYTESDGLPDDIVYGILEDDAGHLWLSTNRGLARFDPDAETFQIFGLDDGLQSDEFNGRAALRLHDGALVFGGINGFNIFHPDSLATHATPPRLALTSFRVLDRETPLPSGDPSTPVRLDYRQNFLSFEFAALDFAAPEHNRYLYRLDGVDDGWVEAGPRRFASYPGLKPGHYTFHVRGANSDGVWNEAGLSIPLHIVPPFWMTSWFRLVVWLALLGAAGGTARYAFTHKLRRQVRALETERRLHAERERISRDLHDNVGAQVSNIISGIELIHLSTKAGKLDVAEQYLDSLGADAQETMRQLRETIWALHQERVSVLTFRDQVHQFLVARARYRERPKTHCTAAGDTSAVLSPMQALNLFRIAQEAVNNALRHACADNVYVALHADAGALEMRIRDDGKFRACDDAEAAEQAGDGIEDGDVRRRYGMEGMRHRAAEMGATFDLRVDDGTCITVRVALQDAPTNP